jgi:hypothetical protein
MRRTLVFICVCCLAAAPAAARMYQWHNPATGTTQLSGTPPAWYRSHEPGPRVYVFENNQLVDDTGIAVSDEQRAALRAEAFGDQHASHNSSSPAAAQDSPPARAEDAPPAPISAPRSADNTPPASGVETAKASKAASLKALIDAWDQRQLDEARSLLDMLPSETATAPARP